MLEKILCIIGDLTPIATALASVATVAVSIAVLLVTRSFNCWQKRLAREQLRHQLYDRRMRVYESFRLLVLKLPEIEIDEISTLYRNAVLVRHEVPFLFDDNAELEEYLDKLLRQIEKKVLNHQSNFDRTEPSMYTEDPEARDRQAKLRIDFFETRLEILNANSSQLPEQFKPFLMLTDLSEEK